MGNQGYNTTKNLYVVFCKGGHDLWWKRWLKEGFGHVYIVQRSLGGEFWIIADPMLSHLDLRLEMVVDYPHIRILVGPWAVVLPVKAKIDGSHQRVGFALISCVEIAKAVLGIKKWWIVTPWQLYKHLTRG